MGKTKGVWSKLYILPNLHENMDGSKYYVFYNILPDI